MYSVDMDRYFGEPARATIGKPKARYMSGLDGRRNVVLVVGSRVVGGNLECVGNLGDGVWLGSGGKDLSIWTNYLPLLLRTLLFSSSRAHLPCRSEWPELLL